MKSKIITGNVIDAKITKEVDFIAHVCNCQRTFGSGVAKQVKQVFPAAYREYYWGDQTLGNCIYAEGVFNLLAQDRYGYDKRHLNYGALTTALFAMQDELWDMRDNKDQCYPKWRVGMPYKIGCDRAGGEWEVVKEMIEFILEPVAEVIFYKLEG